MTHITLAVQKKARHSTSLEGTHTHGDFKVVAAEAKAKAKADYTREQWEVALDKAMLRAEPDEWPLIITDDFF